MISYILKMRDMAQSIGLIKLDQIMMRKKFDFLFLTTLMRKNEMDWLRSMRIFVPSNLL